MMAFERIRQGQTLTEEQVRQIASMSPLNGKDPLRGFTSGPGIQSDKYTSPEQRSVMLFQPVPDSYVTEEGYHSNQNKGDAGYRIILGKNADGTYTVRDSNYTGSISASNQDEAGTFNLGEFMAKAAIAYGAGGGFSGSSSFSPDSFAFSDGASAGTAAGANADIAGSLATAGGGATSYPVDMSTVKGTDLGDLYENSFDNGSMNTALNGGGGNSLTYPMDEFIPKSGFGDDAVMEQLSKGILNPETLSSLPKGLMDIAKQLVQSGGAKDIVGALATLYGQNAIDKSTGRDIAGVYDRIEKSNPFANDKDLIGAAKDNLTNPLGKQFLSDLFGRSNEFINPYKGAADQGFSTAANLLANPRSHTGYNLAETSANNLNNLYNHPMDNPLMQAVSRLTAENASRRSAAGRGLNAGSMPAEMQDALMAALSQNYANIANPMNQSVQTGSNWYQGDVNAGTSLGSAAAQANANAANSFGALANAGTGAWDSATRAGAAAGGLATAHLPNMGQLSQMDLASRLMTDPTRANIATFGNQTGQQAGGGAGGALNHVIDYGLNKGLDWLGSLF